MKRFNPILNLTLQILIPLFLSSTAHSRLDFTQLKGMQEHIQLKPEYDYLDPIEAFNLQRQNFLVNLVNYPEEDEPAKVDEEGKVIVPPKLDPIANWVSSVFIAPQHTDSPTYFQVSPLSKNFGRFLGPSTIGSILGPLTMSESGKEKLKPDTQSLAQLKQELKNRIENDLEFQENVKTANETADQYQRQLDELEGPSRKEKEKELIDSREQKKIQLKQVKNNESLSEELTSQIKAINKATASLQKESRNILAKVYKTSDYQRLREKRDQFKYHKKYLDTFLEKLLNAWLSESSASLLTEKGYPKHIVERVLTALAWMNTRDQDKEQFVSLYDKVPHLLQDTKELRNKQWLTLAYTERDYQDKTRRWLDLSAEAKAQYLLKNPEEAAFLSHGQNYFELDRVPEIGYRTIHYHSRASGEVSFSDCMESSILNFLAITLRHPETGAFDPELLQHKLKAQHLKLNPELLEFAKRYSNLNSLTETATHEKWVALVSDLKGIQYVHTGYEMDTQISNIFQIMDYLLFNPVSSEGSPLKSLKTNQKKMDRLCHLLSQPGMKLEWSVRGGKKEDLDWQNSNLILEFAFDGRPYFEWRITSGHSEIHDRTHSQRNWRIGLVKAIIQLIDQKSKETPTEHSSSAHPVQALLGVMGSDDIGRTIQDLKGKKEVIRSMNLDSNERKLRVYEESLKTFASSSSYKFLRKIQKSLPQDDIPIQTRLSAAEVNAGYPWGYPKHARGKPDVKYPRVTSEQQAILVAKYGKYFENAVITPRGWIVGEDQIKNEDGELFGRFGLRRFANLSWQDAKKECSSLNPNLPEDQQPVLLPNDEQQAIGKDLGTGSPNGYVPQFFRNMYDNFEWSSSPHRHHMALVFNGTFGFTNSFGTSNFARVRCAVEAGWLNR